MTELVPEPVAPCPHSLTPNAVWESVEVQCYLRAADEQAVIRGYTEHGVRHCWLVSTVARSILVQLGLPPRRAELAAIAGVLHDTGNLVGRELHAAFGANMALGLLQKMGMSPEELVVVVAAIANHDENGGEPVSEVSAALILADKSDVHHSRVRNHDPATYDIHDSVNHAAQRSFVRVDAAKKLIAYELTIDTASLPGGVFDYFEIFMPRMLLARKAARFLGCGFELHINNTRLA